MLVPRVRSNAVGAANHTSSLANNWLWHWSMRLPMSFFRIHLALKSSQTSLELQHDEHQGLHQLCQVHVTSSFFEPFHCDVQRSKKGHFRTSLLSQSYLTILHKIILASVWTYTKTNQNSCLINIFSLLSQRLNEPRDIIKPAAQWAAECKNKYICLIWFFRFHFLG